MKRAFFILTAMLLGAATMFSQVTIGDNKNPEAFSILELISNNTRGLRLPQLTIEEREVMQATVEFQAEKTGKAMGLQIFNTTTRCVETWNGNTWIAACEMCGDVPCIYQPNTQPTCEPGYYQADPSKYVDIIVDGFTDGTPGSALVGTVNGAYTVPAKKTLRFLTYNLGANPALTPKQQMAYDGRDFYDLTVYGGLYQWGRNDLAATFRCEPLNGNAATDPKFTQELALADDSNADAVAGKFIYGSTGSALVANSRNWISPSDDLLWGNGEGYQMQYPAPAKTASDPCPAGFRIPTQHELAMISYEGGSPEVVSNDEYDLTGGAAGTILTSGIVWVPVSNGEPNTTWGEYDMNGYALYTPEEWATYDSGKPLSAEDQPADPLMFMPAAGYRSTTGPLHKMDTNIGRFGRYRTNVTTDINAYNLYFYSNYVNLHTATARALGYSVRCICETE